MTKKLVVLCILSLALPTTSSWADPLTLANGFNVFVHGDMSLKADVGGRTAVGGNATFTSFAIGSGDNSNNGAALTQDPARLDLVVGGHASLTNGSVNKGRAWAGSASQSSVGYHTPGASMQTGGVSPVDFAAEFAALDALSQNLLRLAGNGTSVRTPWNTLTLKAEDAVLNVFDIDASLLSGLSSLDIIVPTTSTVLFNVTGTSLAMRYMGIQVNGVQNNAMSSQLLWNFSELTTLDLTGLSWRGSILAPSARMTFANGNINGQLVVASLQTDWGGEYHNFAFSGDLPRLDEDDDVAPVPEPVTLLLLAAAGGYVARRRWLTPPA